MYHELGSEEQDILNDTVIGFTTIMENNILALQFNFH